MDRGAWTAKYSALDMLMIRKERETVVVGGVVVTEDQIIRLIHAMKTVSPPVRKLARRHYLEMDIQTTAGWERQSKCEDADCPILDQTYDGLFVKDPTGNCEEIGYVL